MTRSGWYFLRIKQDFYNHGAERPRRLYAPFRAVTGFINATNMSVLGHAFIEALLEESSAMKLVPPGFEGRSTNGRRRLFTDIAEL